MMKTIAMVVAVVIGGAAAACGLNHVEQLGREAGARDAAALSQRAAAPVHAPIAESLGTWAPGTTIYASPTLY